MMHNKCIKLTILECQAILRLINYKHINHNFMKVGEKTPL